MPNSINVTANTDSSVSDAGNDSIQISKYALNFSRGSAYNDTLSTILDPLVCNGTITKEQESSIKNAFTSTRNSFPTYSNNPGKNPHALLNKLVLNGIITNHQACTIISAFLYAREL